MVCADTEARTGTAMELVTDRPSTRTSTPQRRFRLLDAMILVAATAVGCGGMRRLDLEWEWREWVDIEETFLSMTLEVGYLTIPHVLMWTLALIPIRMLGPPEHASPATLPAGNDRVVCLRRGHLLHRTEVRRRVEDLRLENLRATAARSSHRDRSCGLGVVDGPSHQSAMAT